ncbi:hypothetical protein L7F22_053043 [Adiantum nelumboides]|nr:hypothetical protein [Adiantum nelumboides]
MLFASSKSIHRLLVGPSVGAFSRAWTCSFSMAEEAPLSKRLKLPLSIGTHNGTFHCDEALGCFLLKLNPQFRDARIVRTRDPQALETLDAVLDVGGVYEHERYRYDHHQKGFEVSFGHGFSTKLSSAGLVYKHFGLDIVSKEMGLESDHPDVIQVYKALYKSFVEVE